MTISGRLRALRNELGNTGIAALVLLAAAAGFFFLVQEPLDAYDSALGARLASSERRHAASDAHFMRTATPAAKVAAFYNFLKSGQQPTEWLGKLYSDGRAAGLDLPAANYRMQKTGTRIERYEIALPVTGTYAQIRTFLGSALADIPILSLDQVKFRKERAADPAVNADIRFTLHLVNP